jgi:hypothetical protein
MKKRNLFGMRLLLLSVFCLFVSTVMAEDQVLKVWLADGQVMSTNLNEEPRTTYNDGNLVITTTKTTISYPLEQVKRYTYASASSGITSPKSAEATFSADGETLTFKGLKTGTSIMLYNVAGQLLRKVTPTTEGHAAVSVSKLPTGVYVVKMNDATYKITKR